MADVLDTVTFLIFLFIILLLYIFSYRKTIYTTQIFFRSFLKIIFDKLKTAAYLESEGLICIFKTWQITVTYRNT